MDLFEPLKIKITIPERIAPTSRIAGNAVRKLLFRKSKVHVKVEKSEFPGYFKLITGLEPPLDKVYLKDTSTKSSDLIGQAILISKTPFSLDRWDEHNELHWRQFPDSAFTINPTEINEMWRDNFRFREQDTQKNYVGLRRPQLGALHAIAAHFTSDFQVEPATVVLPTGTGKTETMLATMIYQRCEKILVMVPSDSLRNQISKKFIDLGYLPELSVVPENIALPYVAIIKKGLQTVEDANALANAANVIIATTSVLTACSQAALDEICKLCSHLFVDEAHHISATSWLAVRERFRNKQVIQFTATPFRNDKKSLGGKIIFNYTMGEAQRAGYFTNVNLLPVEEYYADMIDTSIAKAAVNQLRADLENGYDHLLMARISNKDRADELVSNYQEIAPDLNPIVVHSGYTKSEVKNRLENLISRQS